MLSKMVITHAQGKQKGICRIICLEYTLNHNPKENKLYTLNPPQPKALQAWLHIVDNIPVKCYYYDSYTFGDMQAFKKDL